MSKGEAQFRVQFGRRGTAELVLAVFFVTFMGFLSWRGRRPASTEAARTCAARHTLQSSLEGIVASESSSRSLARLGNIVLLAHYRDSRERASRDLDRFRRLAADSPIQQQRVSLLAPQIHAAPASADGMVMRRLQRQTPPEANPILESEKLLAAVQAMVHAMQPEESGLLRPGSQIPGVGRRVTPLVTASSTLVAAIFLVLSGFAIHRVIAEEKLAAQTQRLLRKSQQLTRSRQAFESQRRMLRSVLDSMAEGLVATDEQGNFIIWNPAAERIVGMGAASLSSQQWSEHYGLFLDDMVTPFPTDQNPLLRAIRGEISSAQMFVRNLKLAEGAWIEANAGPMKDQNGKVCGGVVAFRDITEKKNAEREIQRLNSELELRVAERTAQLEEANQDLESFTYSVAHDLRAPLRHVAGFSGILVEEFSPLLTAEAQRYLRRIQEGTQKMGRLVDELLTLARVGRQALKLQVSGLNSMVQEVIELLQPELAGRQVEWKIADLPSIECDPTLLRQVFQNLISNAIKYSRPRPLAVIEIGQACQNDQPVLFVRDNGVGFSMKYADKLFGVFQRLHRTEDFEGTGVGLATVQRIIKKHHGRVWAEAELDRGATFYFTLSALQPADAKELATAVGA